MIKRALLGLLIIFVAVQFIRPDKNLSARASTEDISATLEIPGDVRTALEQACYDCHSNNTRYPWYAEVQPVSLIIANHVADGKKHLNFSTFSKLNSDRAKRKLRQIADEVSDHGMPLSSYTWMHSEARLSDDMIKKIAAWAEAAEGKIK